jgi:CDP-diacylglycerol--serine O-phosphatidyltransferase
LSTHIDTGEEDIKPRRRGIYLLPNLLTTGCVFSGFYAIVAAIDKHFDHAGIAVFCAMIFDTLDGRIARLTKTESAFGKEYDSLADMVSFGLAPAIVAYQWGVVRIAELGGHYWGRFGWLACFFYAVCAALRLARFNARSAQADKRYFEGLPSPSAAAIVAAFVWFSADYWTEPGLPGLFAAFIVTACAGALMVSSVSYPSFKQFKLDRRIKFYYILIVPLFFLVIAADTPSMLLSIFGTYAVSAPVVWAARRLRRLRRGSPAV